MTSQKGANPASSSLSNFNRSGSASGLMPLSKQQKELTKQNELLLKLKKEKEAI